MHIICIIPDVLSTCWNTSCRQPTRDYSALGVAKAAGRVRVILRGAATWWWRAGHWLRVCLSLTMPTVWMYTGCGIKNFTFILKWSTSGMEKTWTDFSSSHLLYFSVWSLYTFFCITHSHEFSLPFWERMSWLTWLEPKMFCACQHKIGIPSRLKDLTPNRNSREIQELRTGPFFMRVQYLLCRSVSCNSMWK